MVASLFGGATVLALHKGAPTAAFMAIAGSLAWLGAALILVAADPARLRRSHAWATAAAAAVPAFLVADLAWNNGPNESTALPPAVYEVLRPESRDPLLGALKARLGDGSLDRIELAGLGFHWPNASLVHRLHNALGYNPVRLALYAAATGAEDTRRAAGAAQVLAAFSVLPLDAGRPSGAALHRHRRADRDHRPEAAAGRSEPSRLAIGGRLPLREPARHAARAVRGPRGVRGFRRAC